MESSWFSQRNNTLCLQLYVHSRRAFEPAEAVNQKQNAACYLHKDRGNE